MCIYTYNISTYRYICVCISLSIYICTYSHALQASMYQVFCRLLGVFK